MNALGFARAGASGAAIGESAVGIRNGGAAGCGELHCDTNNAQRGLPTKPWPWPVRLPKSDSPIPAHDYRHIRYS